MKQQQFWMDEGEWQSKVVVDLDLPFCALRVLCSEFSFPKMLGNQAPRLKDK